MMQGNEIEGGGFRGRTNKLVDGCYSWWVGGLFALVSEMMGEVEGVEDVPESKGEEDAKDGEWVDHDGGSSFPFRCLRVSESNVTLVRFRYTSQQW
jgi:hypothetical protein